MGYPSECVSSRFGISGHSAKDQRNGFAFVSETTVKRAVWLGIIPVFVIRYRVLCSCQCGRKTRVSKFELLRGETESCGCLSRELLAKRNQENPPTKTHGATSKSASPALRRTFSSWKAAKARTTNPNGKDHHLYYDRGIKMCRRWFNSFAAFLKDMGERPESMTLDRKNPDKDYTKSNCRWADATTQTNNRRKQRYVKRPTLRTPLAWEWKNIEGPQAFS